VLRFDHDLPHDPQEAAKLIVQRIETRGLPFHWFRAVLKGPDWYIKTIENAKQSNPKIELLDAPTFWELYRIYLKQTPTPHKARSPPRCKG